MVRTLAGWFCEPGRFLVRAKNTQGGFEKSHAFWTRFPPFAVLGQGERGGGRAARIRNDAVVFSRADILLPLRAINHTQALSAPPKKRISPTPPNCPPYSHAKNIAEPAR